MPNSQTLQLYLDLTQNQASQDGLFAANATGHASKVWIDQSGVSTPDHALTVSFAAQVATGLQLTLNLPAGWSYVEPSAGQCLRVTAVFGRDHHRTGTAVFASPFTIGDVAGAGVCTVFDQWYTAAQLASNSVTLPFGTPRLSSGFPNNGTDKYAFIVAITLYVSDGSTTRTFTAGHDPQYDVGL